MSTDFPIQNLPFGVFRRTPEERGRIGVAIGENIVDLTALVDDSMLSGVDAEACRAPMLNPLMSLGHAHTRKLREQLAELIRGGLVRHLVPMAEAEMLLPVEIGDYTDFYASIHHATNIGRLFRPDNPLLPNYKHVPIGYHGRASSIVVSGTPVPRPRGQTHSPQSEAPVFGPSQRLDYELELGFFIGQGNELGSPIPVDRAGEHIFGFCLVNDWSARDIQAWEYQPLGPFLAKSFATTISPWVIPTEALDPFRVPAVEHAVAPLQYLWSGSDQCAGAFDLVLEVYLQSSRMREAGVAPLRLSRGNFSDMYWTVAQLVAHHSSNGCNLRTGDLLASGTVSGPSDEARGCLLELTRGGAEPIALPTGETRRFLEDGDAVTLRGCCQRAGCTPIGFGTCQGRIGSPVSYGPS